MKSIYFDGILEMIVTVDTLVDVVDVVVVVVLTVVTLVVVEVVVVVSTNSLIIRNLITQNGIEKA